MLKIDFKYLFPFFSGLAVGIYTTNTADACAFVAEDSKANIMVVENHQQLQKILEVKHKLPLLKAIIVYSGEVAVKQSNIYSVSNSLYYSFNKFNIIFTYL